MESQQKIINANSIFDTGFLCGKSLYLYLLGKIPSAHYVYGINGEKAFDAIKEKYQHMIASMHAYRFYDKDKKDYAFDETYLVMNNGAYWSLKQTIVKFIMMERRTYLLLNAPA